LRKASIASKNLTRSEISIIADAEENKEGINGTIIPPPRDSA
jgi:hypothetical protein